jgi:phage shock protein C
MLNNRLTRSRSDRLIGGVAGGLAAYFSVDTTFVRLAIVLLALFFNVATLLAYLALWLLLPNDDSIAGTTPDTMRENLGEMQRAAEGLAERVRGLFTRL